MKAYQLMMFLLLFNICISVVSVLSIYRAPVVTVGDEYDVTTGVTETSSTGPQVRFFGSLIVGVVTGIIAGAIISYLTNIPADAAFAYSLFGSTFWSIAYSAVASIGEIYPNNVGVSVVIGIFIIVLAGTFAAGIAQLIRGGWKSFV